MGQLIQKSSAVPSELGHDHGLSVQQLLEDSFHRHYKMVERGRGFRCIRRLPVLQGICLPFVKYFHYPTNLQNQIVNRASQSSESPFPTEVWDM